MHTKISSIPQFSEICDVLVVSAHKKTHALPCLFCLVYEKILFDNNSENGGSKQAGTFFSNFLRTMEGGFSKHMYHMAKKQPILFWLWNRLLYRITIIFTSNSHLPWTNVNNNMQTFLALSSVIFLCSSSCRGSENSDNISVRQFEFRLSWNANLNSSTRGDFLKYKAWSSSGQIDQLHNDYVNFE